MSRCARLLAAAALLCGCAGSTLRPDPLATHFARADARRAQQLAPDLHARAERARQQALHAEGPAAQADHVLRARLLLLAAIAEADRIELDRKTAGAEARATSALEQRAASEHARRAIEQQIARVQAATRARAEAAHAFGVGGGATGARASSAAPAERARSAEFMRDRARLLLAAALGLGLGPERATQVEQRIAEAERAGAGAAGLAAAEAALAETERALGEARAARSPVPEAASAAEVRSLQEMAAERGLTASIESGGVMLVLDPMFASGSAQPTPAGRSRLAQLAALARAHPHGTIQLHALAADGASAAAQRLARARAALIERELARATEPSRIQIVTATPGGVERLQVVFTAYRAVPDGS